MKSGVKWAVLLAGLSVLMALLACQAPVAPAPTSGESGTDGEKVTLSGEDATIKEEKMAPILRDGLRRNCQPAQNGGGLEKKGLEVGETAIDFTLRDMHGNEYTLSEMLKEKPVVMEFGSFT